GGKTTGEITIPSSLDKAETCIVAAALEVIQRIGPCNAKVDVLKIEDVRISKRSFVIERAKALLRNLTDTILPDSQELADEVAQSVRVMEVTEWGKDRLPAGPSVDESDEVILVEGRADVLNLLKHGFKNCVGLNGTSIPETITQLAAQKVITAFVDGDRGGDLIIRELMNVAEIDFVCKAPDGKEVEEITQKEIHKALRGKIAAEQVRLDIQRAVQSQNGKEQERRRQYQQPPPRKQFPPRPMRPAPVVPPQQTSQKKTLAADEKERLKSALDDLFGTRGAYLLDKTLNVLGKVPVTELKATIKSVNDVHAIVLDGTADQELLKSAEDAHVNYIVTVDSQVKNNESKVIVLTDAELAT
ncbi:MAG TPA: DNA primase DnaG, partial [Candidatus Nanoarchaeia archaeon]|nr:DNA primase DnaG [Candidatus Nanoarchaeia archaeon]